MRDNKWFSGLAFGLVIGLAVAAGIFAWLSGGLPGWWSHDGALVTSKDTLANWLVSVFSFVAAVFLWLTLLATQEMAKDTREIGKAQTRAYVHAEKANFFWGGRGHNHPRVELWVNLIGQTPAKSYEIRARHLIIERGEGRLHIPWGELSDEDSIGRWSGLSPDKDGRRTVIGLRKHAKDISELSADMFSTPTHEFYIFGDIHYTTYFDEKFVTQFCFGRTGLPPYELGETRTVEVRGISVNNNKEVAIPLPRPSCDMVIYQQV